jgi:hypothetical protein
MKPTLALLALLAAATRPGAEPTAAPLPRGTPEASSVAQTPAVGEVIDKAMAWLAAHPADIRDGDVIGVTEEILFFYALDASAAGPVASQNYRRQITQRHTALVSLHRDSARMGSPLQGNWVALTYPPLAHIIARMGLENTPHRAVIDHWLASRTRSVAPRHAMRLWIAVYLERLGYRPEVPLPSLLADSALQQDPQARALLARFAAVPLSAAGREATIQLVYNITHEIIALTDFGALRPPAVMVAQAGHYARLLDAAIAWATRESAIDVLAELIFSAHLLELHHLAAVPAGLKLIINSQQADGSFGVTNPERADGRRHGVLTCLLALKTLDSRAPPPGGQRQ